MRFAFTLLLLTGSASALGLFADVPYREPFVRTDSFTLVSGPELDAPPWVPTDAVQWRISGLLHAEGERAGFTWGPSDGRLFGPSPYSVLQLTPAAEFRSKWQPRPDWSYSPFRRLIEQILGPQPPKSPEPEPAFVV